ncbi:MAG: hypothetical protein KGH98_02430 [Candidatus Micrarchaeota archaeon]|nr:hypothetical protein [Candidatus Micrarchaeota archaeon]
MMIMKIAKRGHPKFNVPNFGTKKRSRVPERWRKQRGIDNKKRIKKSFMGAEPTIGYGNPAEIRGIRANGRRIVIVNNIKEVEAAASAKDRNIDITIGHAVSRRKRVGITKAAEGKGFKVTNGVRA